MVVVSDLFEGLPSIKVKSIYKYKFINELVNAYSNMISIIYNSEAGCCIRD